MDLTPNPAIQLANNEVGYKEKRTNEYLYSKSDNAGSNNYNKYAYEMDTKYPDFFNGAKNGFDWCAVFVAWLFVTAYGEDNALRMMHLPRGNMGASCTQMVNYYRSANSFGSEPRYGAQIFFGSGDGSSYHTGIVVYFTSTTVTTIEGNAGDKVTSKTYYRNNNSILGYGYPSYEAETKTVHEIAEEVIDGLWGANPERRERLIDAGYDPDEVQAEVNQILYGSNQGGQENTPRLLTINVNTNEYDRVLVVLNAGG